MLPFEINASFSASLSGQAGQPVKITSVVPVGGGCINEAIRISTDAGEFFLKYNLASGFPGMFESEARGLILLAESGSIRVPAVVKSGESGKYAWLALELIAAGSPGKGFWQDFGRSLANLHRQTQELFGLDFDNYMGSLPQSNRRHGEFAAFFIEERLIPQVKRARDVKKISPALTRSFDSLYARLQGMLPLETPSLVHGDLWSGNFMVTADNKPCLIDPAVHYGHRESDIAMSRLFGGFHDEFYHAYHEHSPLEKGWEERVDIFNLYPLLIHVNLFGGGYARQVERIVGRF